MGLKSHNSCKDLNSSMWIYIYSLINLITNNEERFQTAADVHSVNTSTISINQGIKIFSSLPSDLGSLMNEKAQFKIALKRYLHAHSFYSVDEYWLSKSDSSI
jgi:hypothetical protein